MKTIRIAVLIVAFFTSYLALSQGYPGTNLRGKIVNQQTGEAVIGVSVDIYLLNKETDKWVLIQSTVSGDNGFYFFSWIPPDDYVIQVNRRKNYNVSVRKINYEKQRYQDLPILRYKPS